MKRIIFVTIVALVTLISLVIVLLLHQPSPQSEALDLSSCDPERLAVEKVVDCWASQASARLREDGVSPVTLLPQIEAQLAKQDFQIAQFCHNAMHTSGRQFAKENNVTLTTLQNYIPKSDSSNCPAGFVHGMISVIGVNPDNAPRLIALCSRETTRARRLACAHGLGHAFRRSFINDDNMSKTIAACDRMGAKVASDCAQGAYHDYLFAFAGIDDTTKPKGLTNITDVCRNKPSAYIGECWFRLFTYYPDAFKLNGSRSLERFCSRQDNSDQCFAAGVSAFVNPPRLPDECRRFRGRDAEACFAGVEYKVPEVLEPKTRNERTKKLKQRQRAIAFLMKRCLLMPDKRGERACVYWLSYDSVNGLSIDQSQAEEEAICRQVNDDFIGLCKRGVAAAQRRDFGAS